MTYISVGRSPSASSISPAANWRRGSIAEHALEIGFRQALEERWRLNNHEAHPLLLLLLLLLLLPILNHGVITRPVPKLLRLTVLRLRMTHATTSVLCTSSPAPEIELDHDDYPEAGNKNADVGRESAAAGGR